jgi:hypothetical protein
VLFRSLLSSASIQGKKLGNPIPHEGAMSFFWWRAQPAWTWSVPSSIMTHLNFFSRFSRPEFQNQTFLCHCTTFSLTLRFKPKNSKIRYRTRELCGFSDEAWSWSVPSLVLTHLDFFSRFGLSFEIQTFLRHCITYSLALRFKPKNLEIRYRTRELCGLSGEACSWSVPSSNLTHLNFFSRFSRTEFQNPKCLVPLQSFLSCVRFKWKKLINPILHEGAMSFF